MVAMMVDRKALLKAASSVVRKETVRVFEKVALKESQLEASMVQ